MIKFTVLAPAKVREMKGTSAKSGKAYHMAFQDVYAHTIDKDGVVAPFPEKLEVQIELDQRTGMPVTLPAGEYTLHPSSFYIDREGRPAVSPRLTPIKKTA